MDSKIKIKNEKLIEDFAESKKTENTRKSYKSDINIFSKFIKKNLTEVTVADINKYFREMEKEKSNATLNRYIRSLYDFYDNLIYCESYTGNNPLGRTKGYKVDNTIVKTEEITLDQFRDLIKLIKNNIKKSKGDFQKALQIRNLCFIMMEGNSGYRVSELLNLTFDNIDFEEYKVILEEDETKGKKRRVVKFDEKVFDYLNDYLEVRNILLKDKKCDYVFLSKSGEKFDYTSYNTMLKNYGKQIGISNLCSHSFRILYTVGTYKATNYNLVKTQMLVGHASLNQTRAYTKLKLDENELIKLPTAKF